TGFNDEVMRGSANIPKLNLPVVCKSEIEHAIRHPLERRLLGVSPLVEQYDRVILGIGVHNRELAIGPSTEIHRHDLRLPTRAFGFIHQWEGAVIEKDSIGSAPA